MKKWGMEFVAWGVVFFSAVAWAQSDDKALLPEWVRDLSGISMRFSGPNCWNTSLVTAGVLPSIRYTSPEEMTFWMESPLCVPKAVGEAPQWGDIVAIRTLDGAEVHGYFYLTEELNFSKFGSDSDFGFEVQKTQTTLDYYNLPKQAFTCESWDHYRSRRPDIPAEFLRELEKVENLEKVLSRHLRYEAEDEVLPMEELKKTLKEELSRVQTRVNEDFLWRGLMLRIQSLQTQLEIIEHES